MLHEVVIGTSGGRNASDDLAAAACDTPPEPPSLSTVEQHVQRLRYELCGDRHAPSGYATRVRIPPGDLTRITSLVDLLDQLRYWAIEESTTFSDQSSRLAQTEAPETVVACVCSGRPVLVTHALKVAQSMLPHPQTAWELRRVVRLVQDHNQIVDYNNIHKNMRSREDRGEEGESAVEGEGNGPLNGAGDPLLVLLADIMQRHASAAPLLTEAISTATAILQTVLTEIAQGVTDDDAVVLDRLRSLEDAFHETPLVFLIESAMRRFAAVVQLQVCGAQFFAALVDLPVLMDGKPTTLAMANTHADGSTHSTGASIARTREDTEEGENEQREQDALLLTDGVLPSAAMAEIIAHSDGVLEVLQCAMQQHRQHLSLCRSVLHVWCVCAQAPLNRLLLLRHGVYGASLRQLAEVGPHTLDVFRTAAEIVGYLMPLLDALQRRSLLWTLRGVLRRRPQLEMIELLLALLVALLTVVSKATNNINTKQGQCPNHAAQSCDRGEVGETDGAAKRDPFAMYALYPQPPASSPVAAAYPETTTLVNTDKTEASLPCRLRLSPLYFQPSSSSSFVHIGSPLHARCTLTDGGDTWQFMLQRCALPQLVSGIHEYFSSCEVVDEKDEADVQRVCVLARAVLSFF